MNGKECIPWSRSTVCHHTLCLDYICPGRCTIYLSTIFRTIFTLYTSNVRFLVRAFDNWPGQSRTEIVRRLNGNRAVIAVSAVSARKSYGAHAATVRMPRGDGTVTVRSSCSLGRPGLLLMFCLNCNRKCATLRLSGWYQCQFRIFFFFFFFFFHSSEDNCWNKRNSWKWPIYTHLENVDLSQGRTVMGRSLWDCLNTTALYLAT